MWISSPLRPRHRLPRWIKSSIASAHWTASNGPPRRSFCRRNSSAERVKLQGVHHPFPLAAAEHLWSHDRGAGVRRKEGRALIAAIDARARHHGDEPQNDRHHADRARSYFTLGAPRAHVRANGSEGGDRKSAV